MARHFKLTLADADGIVLDSWTISDNPNDTSIGVAFVYPFPVGFAQEDLANHLNAAIAKVTDKWTARNSADVVHEFDTEEEWVAWMQKKAVRKNDVAGRKPTIGTTPDGKEWVQLGYILIPAFFAGKSQSE